MLERTTRINDLFDFYQVLLTDKQRKYMSLYYLEDYSLGEISEVCHISRQAVYDNIRRTEKLLEGYEEKLRLYYKFEQRMKIVDELAEKTNDPVMLELIKQLKEFD